jgi:hypothetical protein
MPAIIPFIPLIVGAAAAGTTAYATVSANSNADDAIAEQRRMAADAEKKNAEELRRAKDQMLRRAMPDAQSQTGGALTDSSFAAMVAELAGLPGDIGMAQKLLGIPGTGSGAGVVGGPSTDPGLSPGSGVGGDDFTGSGAIFPGAGLTNPPAGMGQGGGQGGGMGMGGSFMDLLQGFLGGGGSGGGDYSIAGGSN